MPLPLPGSPTRDGFLSGFLLEDDHARVLLVLDEVRDLAARIAADPALQGCDLLIAQCGWFERDPSGEPLVGQDSPLWANVANFERDTLPLIAAARAGRALLTHLSDIHGRTPDEFETLATTLAPLAVQFAYDGLTLEL